MQQAQKQQPSHLAGLPVHTQADAPQLAPQQQLPVLGGFTALPLSTSNSSQPLLSQLHAPQKQQPQEQQQKQQQQEHMPLALRELGWRRPKPLIMSSRSEWQWLPVGPEMGLLWDSTIGMPETDTQMVIDLVRKALTAPLLPAQQQAVLLRVKEDPHLVHALQLTPEQLPLLVEHTPTLAYQLLVCMAGSRCIGQFFEVLAHMPLSLHSMEVVNRLAASGHLPHEVVHIYLSNCINSCDNIPDKFLQSRLVRLVCVFLQSLIRNKVINIMELMLEIQAFCVRFSRIREAASLFRTLKQLEQCDGGSSSSPVAAGADAGACSSG